MYQIKRELVAEKVAQGIINYIIMNDLKPGDKLPTERELAERFVVGRPAVREALCALSMIKIIDIRQGDGIYYRNMSSSFLSESFKIYMDLGMIDIDNFYEVRILVESQTAALAAERITNEEIEKIREYVKDSAVVVKDRIKFINYDVMIHNAIFKAAKNPMLVFLTSSFKDFTDKSRDLTSIYQELRDLAHIGHEKILTALENHDKDAAAQSMCEHLQQVKRFVELDKTIYNEQIAEIVKQTIQQDLRDNSQIG